MNTTVSPVLIFYLYDGTQFEVANIYPVNLSSQTSWRTSPLVINLNQTVHLSLEFLRNQGLEKLPTHIHHEMVVSAVVPFLVLLSLLKNPTIH